MKGLCRVVHLRGKYIHRMEPGLPSTERKSWRSPHDTVGTSVMQYIGDFRRLMFSGCRVYTFLLKLLGVDSSSLPRDCMLFLAFFLVLQVFGGVLFENTAFWRRSWWRRRIDIEMGTNPTRHAPAVRRDPSSRDWGTVFRWLVRATFAFECDLAEWHILVRFHAE